MRLIQNAENEPRREMSTFRRTQTRRIGRKLSPPARRDGKVNCRLCCTSGNDVVDAKRLESCRREAESPKKKNRNRERRKEREKNVKTRRFVPREVGRKYIRILYCISSLLIFRRPNRYLLIGTGRLLSSWLFLLKKIKSNPILYNIV